MLIKKKKKKAIQQTTMKQIASKTMIVTCAKKIVRFLPKLLIITKTRNEGINDSVLTYDKKQTQIKMI